jgi:phosphate transport system permease protein
MNAVAPPVSAGKAAPRSEKFHLWRSRKDSIARWLIAIGGVGVIFAVVLIFFYLLWVVFPMFLPADTRLQAPRDMPGWAASEPVYVSLEEQREVGLRLGDTGVAEFFNRITGEPLGETTLALAPGEQLGLSAEAIEQNGLVAVASDSGRVVVFRHQYETTFDGGVESRRIVPKLDFPYGDQPLFELPNGPVKELAYSDSESGLVVAAAAESGLVMVNHAVKSQNFLTGEVSLESDIRSLQPGYEITGLAVSGNHRWLYLGDGEGRIHKYALPSMELADSTEATESSITYMTMLLGGISVLVGDATGVITQLFPVRTDGQGRSLERIRTFESLGSPIRKILPEERRKGFIAWTEGDDIGIFHSTANRLVRRESLAGVEPRALALAPRANGLMIEGVDGGLSILEIDNHHPEVSFSSLWRKVWYENYEQPEYVWQSSAATNEFEPKFSLTPLVFGTIKAAFYAMIFAIPLALMGAAYTAYFMSPELRKWVKPGIEIMAALPTVILGFLAGLWFAPWVEENLAGLLLIVLVVPPAMLAFSWLWHHWDHAFKDLLPEGWEPMLLLPVLVLSGAAALWIASPLEAVVFETSLRDWMSSDLGISYDQRNALVVGCAMGFAVIPTIFSIAEDAVFGVPKSLSNGSLALGATPWQTLLYVVLPTASPGIFSALMIGLGRAVGETMIVLMATGNTPVMDWNLFEGMRTLAANIAVEMPESEVNSTHYRILFLAALVLFMFTFIVNTGAEIIRQRLREKYSSL